MTTSPEPVPGGRAEPEPSAGQDAEAVRSSIAPVRAALNRALRDMLALVATLAVLGTGAGYLLAGVPGLWGAVIGVGVALVFSGTTVVSMLRTTESSVTTTAAVVLGAWLGKMVVLVAVFALLSGRTFYDKVVLVVVVLVGAAGSALLDYRAVAASRVPYVDPGEKS